MVAVVAHHEDMAFLYRQRIGLVTSGSVCNRFSGIGLIELFAVDYHITVTADGHRVTSHRDDPFYQRFAVKRVRGANNHIPPLRLFVANDLQDQLVACFQGIQHGRPPHAGQAEKEGVDAHQHSQGNGQRLRPEKKLGSAVCLFGFLFVHWMLLSLGKRKNKRDEQARPSDRCKT